MARTRSSTAALSVKFLEDGHISLDAEVVTIDSRESTLEPEEPANKKQAIDVDGSADSEDSDSDSAPEEEFTGVAKQETIERLKREQKRQQDLRRQEREKRKQRDEQLKQQLEARRQRIRELAAAEELPELLPVEVFVEDTMEPQGKHLRQEELEQEEMKRKKKAKLEKLREIKALRKQALKKGPVHVQVQTFGLTKNTVPRAEASVLDTKNCWLMRASLGKK